MRPVVTVVVVVDVVVFRQGRVLLSAVFKFFVRVKNMQIYSYQLRVCECYHIDKQRGSLGNDGELLDEDIFFDHAMDRKSGWMEDDEMSV